MKKNKEKTDFVRVRVDSLPPAHLQVHINWKINAECLQYFVSGLFQAHEVSRLLKDPNPCFRCNNGEKLAEMNGWCGRCGRKASSAL